MARRVRYLNSLCLALVLYSCGAPAPDVFCDAADGSIRIVNKRAYRYGKPFSGCIYNLAAHRRDTLDCCSYLNGKAWGRHITWYPDGHVCSSRYYRDGRKEGVHEAFWTGGRVRFRYTFVQDRYEGVQYEWYENGRPASIRNYREGREQGLQQVFTAAGDLIANYEARNGRNYGNIGTKHCTPAANRPL